MIMFTSNRLLSTGWCVVALFCLSAQAAVATTGDKERDRQIETLKNQLTEQARQIEGQKVQIDKQQQQLDQLKSRYEQDGSQAFGEEGLQRKSDYIKDPNGSVKPKYLDSLFDPKTENKYFTPISEMTPGFPLQNMKLEIGRWDDMNLLMGFQAVMRFQDLQNSDVYSLGVRQPGLEPGFQTPFGDLSFLAKFDDRMDIYYDLYLASRPHEENTYGHEGFIIFHQMPGSLAENDLISGFFEVADVKVGAFDIDFGDSRYRRSNNARVQYNPLIGNFVVDPETEEIGLEIYSKPTVLNWLVGLTGGTTTGHVDQDGGFGLHGKLWSEVASDLRLALSVYRADHSRNGAGYPVGGDKSFLFSGSRSGGPYDGVMSGGDAPGQILPSNGQDVLAVQGDVTWNCWPYEIYGNVGWTRDSDTNGSATGSPEESWNYLAAETVYHLTPSLYSALRYSGAYAQKINDRSSDGIVNRLQAGGGYWIARTMLVKLEYVYQWYDKFSSAGGEVGGIDAWRDPSFNGVILEASFSF
jgi:predicted porin